MQTQLTNIPRLRRPIDMSEETQLFLDQLKIESGKYFEYLLNQGLRDGYREASEAMDHFTKFLKRSS